MTQPISHSVDRPARSRSSFMRSVALAGRRGRWVSITAAVALCGVLSAGACSGDSVGGPTSQPTPGGTADVAEFDPTRGTTKTDETITINDVPEGTDVAGLRAMMTVPGDPVRVWYGPFAPALASRIPGPVDVLYMALIEYPTADDVADLVGEPQGESDTWVPGWFPAQLRAQAEVRQAVMPQLSADAYLSGRFENSYVSVPEGAPNFIVVNYDGS